MLKPALTLWYALAALLGPGVCCCSWVPAKAHAQTHTRPAPKPTRSCCSKPTVPTCADAAQGQKPADDPAKCPCKPHKKVVEANLASASAPDLTGQFRLAEWVAVPLPFDAFDFTLVLPHAGPPDGTLPLGGRALLAAYHILRC